MNIEPTAIDAIIRRVQASALPWAGEGEAVDDHAEHPPATNTTMIAGAIGTTCAGDQLDADARAGGV